MKKNSFLLNPLWNLEMSKANICDDINFLRCIEMEYFTKGEKETSQYLYNQFKAIIITLRKSLEYTQMNMKESIDLIYEEDKKKNNNIGVDENGNQRSDKK